MDVQPHLLNLSAYINQNLEKDLPLSTLAKRVGLSPFHFHRKFGAYFGESLHQHIKRLRLERAAFALIHGTSPVRQIARDSGYKTVSAFSHAFSGFAGESPTRYRSLAVSTPKSAPGDTDLSRLDPAWVGELPPLDFAFLRAIGNGTDVQRSIREAIELALKIVGPPATPEGSEAAHAPHRGNGKAVDANESLECIAATSDVYGIFKGGDFRIDVGLDARRVAPERSGLLGRQTLPGGRYARFDVRCRRDEVVAQCARISLRTLQGRGETARLSQYFVRFSGTSDHDGDGREDFQFFVPLVA